jgi:transmembrane sensor
LYALEEKDTRLERAELDTITETVVQYRPILRPIWQRPVARMAAALLVLVGASWWLFTPKPQPVILEKKLETSPLFSGNQYVEKRNLDSVIQKITLEDGSTVRLYPLSILRYEKGLGEGKRAVYLTGKAFFDIVKNPQKPFWVYTDHISTQVLGTSFLIHAVKNKDVVVEVKTGRVSVYTHKDLERAKQNPQKEAAGVVLTPNQQVAYSTTEERLLKSIVEQPEILVPIPTKEFIVDEMPIAQVFNLLEKTYGINVVYDAKVMENCFLTANLTNASLFKKLDLICKITHATYEKTDAQIVIHSQGCM